MALKSGEKKLLDGYLHHGRFYLECGEFQKAMKNFNEASIIAEHIQDSQRTVMVSIFLGHAFRLSNRLQVAIRHYEKALEISKKGKFKLEEIQAYLGLGHSYRLNNLTATAIKYYKEALTISREGGNEQDESNAYIGLGHTYRRKKQMYLAIEQYQKALEISKQRSYKQEEINAYFGLGETYQLNNQIHSAITNYKEALELAREKGYNLEETNALLSCGYLYRLIHQNQMEIFHYKKALEIAKNGGYKQEETRAYIGLGNAFRISMQSQAAVEHYQKALEIAEEQEYDGLARIASKELSTLRESTVMWKWEQVSIFHREKFIKLRKVGETNPTQIREINGVRVCCTIDFLIGMGGDGTRVYIGLGKDGYERAVKRLPRDSCAFLADKEMRVLNKLNAAKSNYVVNYWFLDTESDKDYLFLILDLCEETLERFVERTSLEDLVKMAPEIIRHILKGLADLHRDPFTILHRDLKPSNILRNVEGNWLLADFGVSQVLPEGVTTQQTSQRGTEDWIAVESSYYSQGMTVDGKVRYKKESDIQVAGIVAFYIVTKGEHPFGKKPDRFRNLLDGKPVGLSALRDPILQDFLSWLLSHDAMQRPLAEDALKHPYLQTAERRFEMLCKVGNQQEIRTGDNSSSVVLQLNSDSTDWKTLMRLDVLKYLCTDFMDGKPKLFHYKSTWTDCLRFMRNVNQHWYHRPRPMPQPEAYFIVGDPKVYFLRIFPTLPVQVHRIVRSCDWSERPELAEYFIL